MRVFRQFSRLVEAIEELGRALERLARTQEDVAPSLERLEALELSRHQFEAQCEGMLLKADGKLKAASNAEARERQLKRSYERDVDPFDEERVEASKANYVVPVDVPGGEEERLPAVRLALATNSKEAAVMAKWSSQR